jgi:hypothetical protein
MRLEIMLVDLGQRSGMTPERAYPQDVDPATLGSIDIGEGLSGIVKDMRVLAEDGAFGWTILIVVLALPVASLLLLARRRWIALCSLVISLSVLVTWLLYYATDWWSNPGQGAWLPAVALVLLGWLVVALELWRMRREPL